MQFAYPQNIWWLVVACGVIAFAVLAMVRRSLALRRLGINDTRASGIRAIWKTAIRVSAVVFLGIALLGPCIGEQVIPTPPARGRDLLVLLDVSRSMLAEDAGPNRLEFAKRAVGSLSERLESQGGYRVGLVAFAERPVLLCPWTTDFRHFRDELADANLQSVRLRETRAVAGNGTELQLALDRALRLLPKTPEGEASCVDVLLVSDGGDDLDPALLKAAQGLGEKHVAVHTLGVGDHTRDSPIPVKLANGGRELLRYQGEIVHTRLQEEPLRQIAGKTGGTYVSSAMGRNSLDRLLADMSVRRGRELNTETLASVPIHRFQWFLLPAVVLLLLENLAGARGRGESAGLKRRAPWLVRLVPPPVAKLSSETTSVTPGAST